VSVVKRGDTCHIKIIIVCIIEGTFCHNDRLFYLDHLDGEINKEQLGMSLSLLS
jgi:hypothetical protein